MKLSTEEKYLLMPSCTPIEVKELEKLIKSRKDHEAVFTGVNGWFGSTIKRYGIGVEFVYSKPLKGVPKVTSKKIVYE